VGTSKQGLKPPLTNSPFVRWFEYGAGNEGYWYYQQMVLHFEDCVNVLKVLYPDFDFLLLFDHLCRHDKQKEDGLNVERMRKGYGRSQRKYMIQ